VTVTLTIHAVVSAWHQQYRCSSRSWTASDTVIVKQHWNTSQHHNTSQQFCHHTNILTHIGTGRQTDRQTDISTVTNQQTWLTMLDNYWDSTASAQWQLMKSNWNTRHTEWTFQIIHMHTVHTNTSHRMNLSNNSHAHCTHKLLHTLVVKCSCYAAGGVHLPPLMCHCISHVSHGPRHD